ncbi:hypothetical protein D9M68_238290 [compost metagenome]
MPHTSTYFCLICDWQQTTAWRRDTLSPLAAPSHCPHCRTETLAKRPATRLEIIDAWLNGRSTNNASARPPLRRRKRPA